MAFVFRNKQELYPRSKTPGPGYYKTNQPNLQNKAPSSAPFNQTSPRKIWKQSKNPGPADYNKTADKSEACIVFQSGNKTYTLNASAQTAIFRSGSERFRKDKQQSPGPGQYVLDKSKIPKDRPVSQHSSLQKYLQTVHAQKPMEEQQDLVLMFGEEDVDTEIRRQQGFQRNVEKRYVPFNSSVDRQNKERPKTSVGPGSYNIEVKNKTQANNGQSFKNEGNYSLSKFVKILASEDKVKPEVPNLQNMFKSEKGKTRSSETVDKKNQLVKKDDFFGSTVSRFYQTQISKTPGPGDYNLISQRPNSVAKEKKNGVCFGRSTSQQYRYTTQPFSSPFGQNNQEKKRKIKKDQKSPGCFGSIQPRFKILKQNQKPLFNNKQFQIGAIQTQHSKLKKSSKRYRCPYRIITKTDEGIDERPISYDYKVGTLESKVGDKYQVNAPFSSQVPRFYETAMNNNNLIEEYLSQNRQAKRETKIQEQKKRPKGLMQSNNPRFDYRQKSNNLSPCTYDPQGPPKKEFNKLFM